MGDKKLGARNTVTHKVCGQQGVIFLAEIFFQTGYLTRRSRVEDACAVFQQLLDITVCRARIALYLFGTAEAGYQLRIRLRCLHGTEGAVQHASHDSSVIFQHDIGKSGKDAAAGAVGKDFFVLMNCGVCFKRSSDLYFVFRGAGKRAQTTIGAF